MPMDAAPGEPRFLPAGSYKLVFVPGNLGNATEAILFTVDAALPIPGQEDSGSSTPSWMWYVIAGVAILVLLLVVMLLLRKRATARARQQLRPGTYQYYSGSRGQLWGQSDSTGRPEAASDAALTAAVIVSTPPFLCACFSVCSNSLKYQMYSKALFSNLCLR